MTQSRDFFASSREIFSAFRKLSNRAIGVSYRNWQYGNDRDKYAARAAISSGAVMGFALLSPFYELRANQHPGLGMGSMSSSLAWIA
jgi:hypothetical protein